MRIPVLLCVAVSAASAQPLLTFGGKVGWVSSGSGPGAESKPYGIGPAVEVRLPAGFAIEGSAIYRRLGQSSAFSYFPPGVGFTTALGSVTSRMRGNSWEFPLIGKYYFHRRSTWQPYIGTGWALRTIGYDYRGNVRTSTDTGDTTMPFNSNFRSSLGVGATGVVGIRLRIGRFALTPEIRYTHWGEQTNLTQRNVGGAYLGFTF